jgi:hypothetical protein
MPTLTISDPSSRQIEFFLADRKVVAYGGA